MKRARKKADYAAAVLVRDGDTTRRGVEIWVRGNDVYAVRPQRGSMMKISYHGSGRYHLKVEPRERAPFALDKIPPRRIEKAEGLWAMNIVDLSRQPPVRGERYDEAITLDAEDLPRHILSLALYIGRDFTGLRELYLPDPEGTELAQYMLREEPPKICVFVRVKKKGAREQTEAI